MATNPPQEGKKAADTTAAGAASAKRMTETGKTDPVEMLKADHRTVEGLFSKFESAKQNAERNKIARDICNELIIHATIEEEIFYPAAEETGVEDKQLEEAQVEHDCAKLLIAEILSGKPNDSFFGAKVKVLSEYIKHHVAEEEAPTGLFAKFNQGKADKEAIALQLADRKSQLKAQAEGRGLQPPNPTSFVRQKEMQSSKDMETDMARQGMPDRDDRGRFMSDDDNGRGRRSSGDDRSYSSRSSRDDDDRYSSRSSGRSSRDDDDRYSSRSSSSGRSSRDDDDRGYSSRSSSSGRSSRDDDDRSYSSRSRYDDDRRSSRSSRDDDDDDNRGSGWFGDSRGHADAARRGWETRRQDDDDDRRSSSSNRGGRSSRDDDDRSYASRSGGGRSSSSSSRYDDDDDRGYASRSRSSSSRYEDDDDDRNSRGGWFGDSRGHSEAARRGWENRR